MNEHKYISLITRRASRTYLAGRKVVRRLVDGATRSCRFWTRFSDSRISILDRNRVLRNLTRPVSSFNFLAAKNKSVTHYTLICARNFRAQFFCSRLCRGLSFNSRCRRVSRERAAARSSTRRYITTRTWSTARRRALRVLILKIGRRRNVGLNDAIARGLGLAFELGVYIR